MDEYTKTLHEQRQKAWEQAKEILDRQAQDKRERTAEENEMYERANADIDRLGKEIDERLHLAQSEREMDVVREAYAGMIDSGDEGEQKRNEDRQVAAFSEWLRNPEARGGWDVDLSRVAREKEAIRMGASPEELRGIFTDGGASGGSLEVPVGFERTLYQYLEASNAVRRIAYVFTTASGGAMNFPKVATHGVGTQVSGQGTTLAGTDPIFGTATLNDYTYGQMVKLSTTAVTDIGFPVESFVAQNIGRALGRVTATAYVTGTGSGAPNGIATAAVSGSVATGGSLITPTFENLISLQHAVVDEYRNSASCAYLMADSTAGTIRKLRDGNGGTEGAFLWTPNPLASSATGARLPDTLLGFPAYTDSNVAAQGSNAKVVYFGDWLAYYVRDVGPLRIERSVDAFFGTDEIAYRGVIRTDADLIDTNAIKLLKMSVS